MKVAFVRQLDDLTTELNQTLRGQLVETIGAVLWMGALGYFVQAWRVKNSENLKELAAILVLIPVLAVVRRIVSSRLVSPSDAIAPSAVVPSCDRHTPAARRASKSSLRARLSMTSTTSERPL